VNIALVTPRYSNNFWNGTGRCSYALAQGLKDLGHSLTVYAYNSSPVTKKKDDNGVTEVSIGGIAKDSKKFGIVYEDVPLWNTAIYREMRREDFNLVICFDWFGYEACQRFVRESNLPTAFVGLVSALGNGSKAQPKLTAFQEHEKAFLDNCDLLVAFTEGSKAEIHKMTATPCQVVHLSTELRECECKPDCGQVLIQGRITRDRYLERGIRSMTDLPWMFLHIVGPGLELPYGQYITETARRLDVLDRIDFKGWIEDSKVSQIYGSAELVLCSSAYDPFGYSAIDAMSFGIPVIGSYEAYRGIIRDGVNGLLFQSLPELKHCLEVLHSSRELRITLAAQAKKDLLETRTIAKSVEQFHEILLNSQIRPTLSDLLASRPQA
jgi:phthiocerol/phenolphthiocerol synthesis type-I polyketide synthase E